MGRDNSRYDRHNYCGPCQCGGGYMSHDYDYKFDDRPYRFFDRRSTGSGRGLEILIKLAFVLLTLLLAKVFPVVGGILFFFAVAMLFVRV